MRLAGRLIAAVVDQAQFQDWVTAEGVNDDLDRFNARANALKTALIENRLRADELARANVLMIEQLFASRDAVVDDDLGDARERVRHQFAEEVAELERAGLSAAVPAWIDAVLAIETAADLAPRDEMRIYAITAAHDELASSDLLAFQGFFDRAYRQHDFDVGRQKAREFMRRVNESGDPIGPIRRSELEPEISIDHALDGLALRQVDSGLRLLFAQRLGNRADEALRELGLPGAVRWALRRAVLDRQIERLLEL